MSNNRLLYKSGEFDKTFTNFSINSAKQFAWSRINRIAHGALSPSNISIEGKWLDVTNTTFVPDDYNYHAGSGDPTFLEEFTLPCKFLNEWVTSFNKSNLINLNVDMYTKIYHNVFQEYLLIYFIDLLRLNDSLLNSDQKKILRHILNDFLILILILNLNLLVYPKIRLFLQSSLNFIQVYLAILLWKIASVDRFFYQPLSFNIRSATAVLQILLSSP